MSLTARDLEPRTTDEVSGATGWLVSLALGTWGALVAGIIVGLGGFADPRPWQNGCVRLMTLGATLAALIWAVRTIYPERARGLKLAVVVSLIVHTLLAVMLSRQRLELDVQDIAAVEKARPTLEEGTAPADAYPLSSSDSDQRGDDWQSLVSATRPIAPASELPRETSLSREIGVTPLADASLVRPSLAPRQLLKRGPAGWTSQELPPAASLATGMIDLPPAELPQKPIRVRSTEAMRPRPAPASSDLGRSDLSMPPIDIIPAPASGAALDVERLQSRRRVDAAPVFALPAESERFAMRSVQPARATEARRPSAAFARRLRQRRANEPPAPVSGDGHLTEETAAVIDLGLEFLARVQLDDGRWEFEYVGPISLTHDSGEQVSVQADAAATGLALLAMLGAGYDHFDGRYRHSIQQGLDYLHGIQSPSGELFPETGQAVGQVTRFYSHGMATLALCEGYGMTGDPQLKRPAQAAIDYLVATQHRELGGWRYEVGTNADLSVTGWQLLALRSGELAGLNVPPQTYERIRECVEQCRDEEGRQALFRYNPWASPTDPRTRHGRQPSTVMTSVGLLAQLQLGSDRTNPQIRAAGDHLLANLPRHGATAEVAATGTLGNPGRDTYYWYYATQAMFHLGDEYWQAWHEQLFPLLIESQTASGPLAGSWDARQPVPDKWATYGGRLYVTAMNLLSLEVANRHLP